LVLSSFPSEFCKLSKSTEFDYVSINYIGRRWPETSSLIKEKKLQKANIEYRTRNNEFYLF